MLTLHKLHKLQLTPYVLQYEAADVCLPKQESAGLSVLARGSAAALRLAAARLSGSEEAGL